MEQEGLLVRLLRGAGLAQRQPDWRRLETDIDGLQAWVESHKPSTATKGNHSSSVDGETISRAIDDDHSSRSWFEVCECYLDKARDAARHDVASGYEYLHIAERESVPGMTLTERKIRAQSLRAEIEKKLEGSWRADAIKTLLGSDSVDVSAQSLAEAIWHRNTHDRNVHRRIDKMRWQLAWLGLIVGVLVLIAFVVAVRGLPLNLESVDLLPYCIYLGLLGGFVSSAISVRGTDRRARVPELEVAFYAAIARGLLGAATSIPVYAIGKAGLVAIGGMVSQTWGLLLLCFVSGFSERWFLNTIAAVSPNREKQSASDKDQR